MRESTRARASIAVLVAGGASCAIATWISGPSREIPFSHAIHAAKEVACVACHGDAESEARAGMPGKDVCLTCHGPKADRPPKAFEAKIVDAKEWSFPLRNASPDVVFSHAKHAEKGYACAQCHGAMEESTEVDDQAIARMEACVACHAKERVANECSTCHSAIRLDAKPPSHVAGYLRFHGSDVRGASDRLVLDRCLLCHGVGSPASCERCHTEIPPTSHTDFWRRRGHGFMSAMDRETCAVCHREDSCMRCHDQMRPVSHAGAWGGTFSAHCVSCHTPLQSNGCAVCHKSTPSHLQAPPKPPPPHPQGGTNCTTCHLPGTLLKHADNGENCNICHF